MIQLQPHEIQEIGSLFYNGSFFNGPFNNLVAKYGFGLVLTNKGTCLWLSALPCPCEEPLFFFLLEGFKLTFHFLKCSPSFKEKQIPVRCQLADTGNFFIKKIIQLFTNGQANHWALHHIFHEIDVTLQKFINKHIIHLENVQRNQKKKKGEFTRRQGS